MEDSLCGGSEEASSLACSYWTGLPDGSSVGLVGGPIFEMGQYVKNFFREELFSPSPVWTI